MTNTGSVSKTMPAALIMLALISCGEGSPLTTRPPIKDSGPPAIKVPFLADPSDPRSGRALKGAKVAAQELTTAKVLGRRVEVVELPPSGRALAGLTDDSDVAGVIVASGSEAIVAAETALDMAPLPVIELFDDLYDTSRLKAPIFQAATPHSWQAFRLARYFGPGDRGYSKVGVAAQPGPEGEAAIAAMKEAATTRGFQVVATSGTASEVFGQLQKQRPQAVVIEGSQQFMTEVIGLIDKATGSYQGRAKIADGWRPQIAGFESMLGIEPTVEGWVAAGDYARPELSGDRIDSVKAFRKVFQQQVDAAPKGDEVRGYTAVQVIAEAVKRAETLEHKKVLDQLKRFDRARFGHLPVSLGPTDRVIAERDVLGLFATSKIDGALGWRHLMRGFTSDLERTNLLEEDWASYFDGTTPGGEAPFFYDAKAGIATDSKDDLH